MAPGRLTRRVLWALVPGVLAGWTPMGVAQSGAPVVEEPESLMVVQASPERLGTVEVGSMVTRRITFKNITPVPVALEVASKTCGCLGAEVAPAEVPPGGETTLWISAGVVASGPQGHSATLRATWQDAGVERSEKIVCALFYEPDIEFTVFPERIVEAAVAGRRARTRVYVHDRGDGPFLRLPTPRCTLPGWEIRAEPDPTVPEGMHHYIVDAVMTEPGLHEGEIVWQDSDASTPALKIRARLRVLSPYRAFPGGLAFLTGGQVPVVQRVRLIPRANGLPAPARVRVSPPVPGLEVRLEGDALEGSLAPGAVPAPWGAARALVLAEDGSVLIDLPIAWYRPE